MKYYITCPLCQKDYAVVLSDDQAERYEKYARDGGIIQELLCDLPAEDRECLITGICPECWEEFAGCSEE